MNRRDFLAGTLAGLATGVGLEKLVDYERTNRVSKKNKQGDTAVNWELVKLSFAQQGEDLIINNTFQEHLKISKPSYIDIGAYHPIYNNNTYLLYLQGSRGVLVEPNPVYADMLKDVRKEDNVLNIGIGVTDETEADYYILGEFSQNNTFSKEIVDRYIMKYGPDILEKVIKMPLVNINKVLQENFTDAPNLFSIDVEGLDLDILKTLDFDRFRPNLFCVETNVLGINNNEIFNFMNSKNYMVRANTYTNTIFIDNKLISG